MRRWTRVRGLLRRGEVGGDGNGSRWSHQDRGASKRRSGQSSSESGRSDEDRSSVECGRRSRIVHGRRIKSRGRLDRQRRSRSSRRRKRGTEPRFQRHRRLRSDVTHAADHDDHRHESAEKSVRTTEAAGLDRDHDSTCPRCQAFGVHDNPTKVGQSHWYRFQDPRNVGENWVGMATCKPTPDLQRMLCRSGRWRAGDC